MDDCLVIEQKISQHIFFNEIWTLFLEFCIKIGDHKFLPPETIIIMINKTFLIIKGFG